jgi:biotin transport system substrate-specific component
MWGMESLFGTGIKIYAISMILGLLACYTVGTSWFFILYNRGAESPATLATVLGWCVIPFLIPDAVKILLALAIGRNPGIRAVLRADR